MNLSRTAFTLIEILIVVSIIAVLSSAMIPSFSGFIRSQNVKQAREQVKSDLRSLQTNAMANSFPISETPSGKVYWGVLFIAGSTKYYYFASTNPPAIPSYTSCYPLTVATQFFSLPANTVTFGTYCLFFDSNSGARIGNNQVIIRDLRSTVYECLKISPAGLITSGSWASSTCN